MSSLTSGSGAVSAWRLIKKAVAAIDGTTLTLSGLNLDLKKAYKLILNYKNIDAATAVKFYLLINGDATATNYYFVDYSKVAGGAIGGGYGNEPIIGYPNNALGGLFTESDNMTLLVDVDGKVRVFGNVCAWDATNFVAETKMVLYDVVVASITQIDLQAQVANMMGAGSWIALYEMG